MVLTVFLCTVLMVMAGMRNQEALSSRYNNISTYYPWTQHLPSLPNIIQSPFKTPSELTLQLENGQVDRVPARLKKTTPNFHLIMPAESDTIDFCKTTASAMMLNYPPVTAVGLRGNFESDEKRQREILQRTLKYLSNKQFVKDHDLILIVDGENTWFQLPSNVIVSQYKRLLVDANVRLLKRYGRNKDGYQKFNQTIVFGADKQCQGDDKACGYVAHSIFSDNLYTTETARRISQMPAKFLNARMVMGPASDLRALYRAAQQKFIHRQSQSQTVQSVLATLFAEQQLSRDAAEVQTTNVGAKMKELLSFKEGKADAKHRLEHAQANFSNCTRQENCTRPDFAVGLDYAHVLFQPLAFNTKDELMLLVHDNSTNLSQYSHPGSIDKNLTLPAGLRDTKPPFSRPDLSKTSPSPHEHSAYISPLEYKADLDTLPERKLPWSEVPLIQNTYTGAVPAIIDASPAPNDHEAGPDITREQLWYSKYKRALLRRYFRTPQSPSGYHDSLVGGDRYWDARGGRGGIWTAAEQLWLAWGELDGVCGRLNQQRDVFGDEKGVWLHERERGYELWLALVQRGEKLKRRQLVQEAWKGLQQRTKRWDTKV